MNALQKLILEKEQQEAEKLLREALFKTAQIVSEQEGHKWSETIKNMMFESFMTDSFAELVYMYGDDLLQILSEQNKQGH